MNIYLETSALLNMLFSDGDFSNIKKIFNKARIVVTSELTILEAKRAIIRAEVINEINESEKNSLLGVVEKFKIYWHILAITQDIETRFSYRFPVEPVRTIDAIHLATSLEFKKVYPDLIVLSSDNRINDNLELLGLS